MSNTNAGGSVIYLDIFKTKYNDLLHMTDLLKHPFMNYFKII